MSEDEDEIVTVQLPRERYETLKNMIKREEAHNWFINWMNTHWLWVIGGGVLTMWALYDKIHLLLIGVK